MEEVLRQLLRGENYGVVYREKDGAISNVLLLSSPVYAQAAPVSENQQARTEASRGSEGHRSQAAGQRGLGAQDVMFFYKV